MSRYIRPAISSRLRKKIMEGAFDLVPYLRSEKTAVKKEALSIVLGLSLDEIFLDTLEKNSTCFLDILVRLATSDDEKLAEVALSCLVNISSRDELASAMGSTRYLGSIFESLKEKHLLGPEILEEKLLMVLANVTRQNNGFKALIADELLIWRLLGYYSDQRSPVPGTPSMDKCSYIGHVLINLTAQPEGRKFLVEMDKGYWEAFSVHTRCQSRRPVILQIVKNICCDPDLVKQIDFLKFPVFELLGRVVYPRKDVLDCLKETSAKDFPYTTNEVPLGITEQAFGPVNDIESRRLVAECVCGLLLEKNARSMGRSLNFYEVMRVWHLVETDPEIQKIAEQTVHLVHYSEDELEVQDSELLSKQKLNADDRINPA
eukprot:Gregarina_sp_Poly_1__10505@NODE_76_length_15862_cov_98_864577_g65_i0_p6_GENE_NODE_76_length_15862_cov_98_864577_g65_i0NODE_76_length_15862_cov_98_864577_g65_i0_p6_ORF_typecomplete_len375_score59_71DUF383/PF04063_14/42DUF383/PF04063_14/7_4e14KAP/PF05804_12/0_00016KAP/PF05804_12/5_1DUF384/PF04064_13/1_7e03DUF384/PF04064_13/5_1e05Arm/PF00514_23/7_7e02Arm/PF00514_23/0_099Cnd1/PF12717_7/0_045Cnd1/PF12717_7/1_5e03Arm_2/PF04826_13/5_1e02Arm_2/PF04826_13/1_1Arm_2/PF04826_13/7_4e02Neurochondrin/PF05536_1